VSFMDNVNIASEGDVIAGSAVEFTAESDMTHNMDQIRVPLHGLSLQIERTQNRARVMVMDMAVDDMDVAVSLLPPHGIRLLDVKIGMGGEFDATVERASETELVLHADLPIALSWSMLLNSGKKWQLGSLETLPMSLDIIVTRDNAGAHTQIIGACTGA